MASPCEVLVDSDDVGAAEHLTSLLANEAWRIEDKYSRCFLLHDGIRFSHILDPTTGWPVPDAPRSITVAAESCTQAGMLSTLGMLKGARAEAFLDAQGVQFWCNRGDGASPRGNP